MCDVSRAMLWVHWKAIFLKTFRDYSFSKKGIATANDLGGNNSTRIIVKRSLENVQKDMWKQNLGT